VPDQFMARLGVAMAMGTTGFAGALAWRAEGVPRYDLARGKPIRRSARSRSTRIESRAEA